MIGFMTRSMDVGLNDSRPALNLDWPLRHCLFAQKVDMTAAILDAFTIILFLVYILRVGETVPCCYAYPA
jgi:hypothetical protein